MFFFISGTKKDPTSVIQRNNSEISSTNSQQDTISNTSQEAKQQNSDPAKPNTTFKQIERDPLKINLDNILKK